MPDMPPQVSTVFKAIFDELRFMKQQQWAITNYSAAILAAIYAVRQQLPISHAQSILKVLAFLTAVVGSALLLRIQRDMARSRHRLNKLHKTYFTPNELRDIGLDEDEINSLEDKTRWGHFGRGWEFLSGLIAVLWVGFVLVCSAM